jgi:hypothetical protein
VNPTPVPTPGSTPFVSRNSSFDPKERRRKDGLSHNSSFGKLSRNSSLGASRASSFGGGLSRGSSFGVSRSSSFDPMAMEQDASSSSTPPLFASYASSERRDEPSCSSSDRWESGRCDELSGRSEAADPTISYPLPGAPAGAVPLCTYSSGPASSGDGLSGRDDACAADLDAGGGGADEEETELMDELEGLWRAMRIENKALQAQCREVKHDLDELSRTNHGLRMRAEHEAAAVPPMLGDGPDDKKRERSESLVFGSDALLPPRKQASGPDAAEVGPLSAAQRTREALLRLLREEQQVRADFQQQVQANAAQLEELMRVNRELRAELAALQRGPLTLHVTSA